MKVKKRDIFASAVLIAVIAYTVGSRSSARRADRSEIAMRAKNFVRRLNLRDYEACCDCFDEELRAAMGPEQMEEAFGPLLDQLGEFTGFLSTTVTIQADEEPPLCRCTTGLNYAGGQTEITILFNEAMEIVGVYM